MSKVTDLSARRANLSADQLALLAKRLRGGAGAAPSRQAMPRRDGGAPAVLSFAQQRLWYLWKLDPDSAAYNLAGGLRLRGPLDAQALRHGLSALVARHASLRTVFREAGDGSVEQLVMPAEQMPLPCIDLAGIDAAAREERMHDEARRLCALPFDLAGAAPLRAALIRLDAGEHLSLIHI